MEMNSKIKEIKQVLREEFFADNQWPWVIGYSGGKDSTLLIHFIISMLKLISPDERNRREIIIANNDTQVESPVFQSHVDKQLDLLEKNLKILNLPVYVKQTHPKKDESFWCCLLGKGYPAPNPTFRWCTNRLKIKPTIELLKMMIHKHHKAVLILGVRKAESAARNKTITKHEANASVHNPNFTPHANVPDCHVFTPLKNLKTWEVFELLVKERPAWGGRNNDLLNLYQDADSGECPFVVSENDSAGCGTSNARFGCWTCTVVKKDKALDSLSSTYSDNSLKLMSDFRVRIKEISDTPEYRCKIRRNGQYGLGPITLEARKKLFEELLSIQNVIGKEILTYDEICVIKNQWRKDEYSDLKQSFGIN